MSVDFPALMAMAPPSGEGQPNLLVQLFPFVLIFLIFYFLLIAPARRKQKKHAEMVDNLKSGDKIITQGGLYGVVKGVSDQVVQVRIADNVQIEVAKNAISALQTPPAE